MKKEEIDKIKEVFAEILKQIDSFGNEKANKKYDYASVSLDKRLMEFIDNGCYLTDIATMKIEISKQKEMISVFASNLEKRYPYLHFCLSDVKAEVCNYENYYVVTFSGNKIGHVRGIFDEFGNFILGTGLYQERLECVDKDNFYVIHQCNEYSYVLHYQRAEEGNFLFVNEFKGCSSVNVINKNLIGIRKNDDKQELFLYNQKTRKVILDDVSRHSNRYDHFDNLVQEDNLVRICKEVWSYQERMVLEFMIDEDGVVVTDIFCFDKNMTFSKEIDWLVIQEQCLEILKNESNKKKGFQKKLVP